MVQANGEVAAVTAGCGRFNRIRTEDKTTGPGHFAIDPRRVELATLFDGTYVLLQNNTKPAPLQVMLR